MMMMKTILNPLQQETPRLVFQEKLNYLTTLTGISIHCLKIHSIL